MSDILASPIFDLLVSVAGFMGAVALIYAVLLEEERRQDEVRVVASASLFLYAVWIQNKIFMFAMAGIFLLAGHRFIQIMRGKHSHTIEEIEEYEHPEK